MLSDVHEGSGTKCTGTGSLATTSVLAVSVIIPPSDFDPSPDRANGGYVQAALLFRYLSMGQLQ
jgi:hypothetical protein